ncbi:MAG: type IX secretion system plug protein domain-containing protein [Balneolaceae bacterium]
MVPTICKSRFFLAAILLLAGCSTTSYRAGSDEDEGEQAGTALSNLFTPEQQTAPPNEIRSLRLYRSETPGSIPAIELDSNQELTLSFDHLDSTPRQFTIEIEHAAKNWEESSLDPHFFVDGFNELYMDYGQRSYTQRPAYRHYEYRFPNDEMQFKISGNYWLKVFDEEDDRLLFTLPFFVHENKGTLESRVETEYARREDLRRQDRLFSSYRYPEIVEFPQFDLAFRYVQNQFWGRYREVRNFDTSEPGTVNFHLSSEEAFLGDYEFNVLDLRSFQVDGRRILSVEPEYTPPRVILQRDVEEFADVSTINDHSRFGRPVGDRDASYADVRFELETSSSIEADEKIYLVGDFNGWQINEQNLMQFDEETESWKGRALIKEGEYAYKYVVLADGELQDLALDRAFTFTRQHYTTLVYFEDPRNHYDRLLNIHEINRE